MPRVKRYDLYEGDGEVIPEEEETSYSSSHIRGDGPQKTDGSPEKAPASGQNEASRRRYFRHEENDGLAEPSALFDDFDRYNGQDFSARRRVAKKKEKHSGAWACMLIAELLVLAGLCLLVLPQTTGVRYRFLPNFAFVNGNLIRLEEQQAQNLEQCRQELYTDTIYQGVYIDGIHVGGMTKEQAAQVVSAAARTEEKAFDISVSVGNQIWHINSERVPVSRNVDEMISRAWAQGRSNTAGIRGSGMTPFQERLNQAAELRTHPVILATEQDYDHHALRELTEGIANYVNRDPVNSMVESFDFNTHTFTFTEDQPGARIDSEDLYNQLTALLDGGTTHTTLRVTPEKILAEVTKTELMNRFGLISAYTTNTTNNKNRNTNIDLSARAINGKTVLPGETFSFNRTTGERTAAKGYKEAAAISGGQSRDEIGGGVCQTSSTLFNAVARADLEIVERNPHAWPSSYVEKGFDATVNWPGLDFQFKNNTDWPIFIVAAYKDRKITVNLYGMSLGADVRVDLESVTTRVIPKPEGTEYVVNPSLAPGTSEKTVTGRKGYVVETWKIWYQGSRETRRELLFTTTYKAYQEKVEYNPR
ncbi:MAG: VanW family protein [Clostridia bacterium]|nr:VanW family protein [Clostridia bacterium]